MKDLRTRLANNGHGLLFELGRHTSQAVQQPNVPASRWYQDISTGLARELSEDDVIAMGLRTPHTFLHSLFSVREDLVVLTSKDEIDVATRTTMQPYISGEKIKEFSLDRNDYSLRCTGGGENFRIEFPNSTASSPNSNPIELLMHAFIPQDSDRIVSFSSRGKPLVANTQLRDLNNPSVILAEWKRSEDCLPFTSAEHIFTLSNDKAQVENRSLRTGELLDTTPFKMPSGTSPIAIHLDPINDLIIGRDSSNGKKGMIVADFRQATQIAFVADAYPLDYVPISKCILFQALDLPNETRRVLSIESGKTVELEGIDNSNLKTLFLCPNEPRAVAVRRDGSIQIHSLPDGKLVSTISSMQNHKQAWILLSVMSVAMWIVCLMVSGKRLAANESLDIVIALVVIWCSILAWHQRTGISFGLGGLLSSFAIGAAFAASIVLTQWSLHNSAAGTMRLVRWTITLGLLLGILGIMVYDELLLEYCNSREATLIGSGLVGIGYAVGKIINVAVKRKHHAQPQVPENQSQWSITHLLWSTTLVAVVLALLGLSTANIRIDWLWLGKYLALHSLLIAVGTYACTVWGRGLHRGKPLVLFGWCAILAACCALVAFLSYRYLQRVFPPIPISCMDFCLWYFVGFSSIFSILVYRTRPPTEHLIDQN